MLTFLFFLAQWNSFVVNSYFLIGGYLMNYIPYFPVERTLFIHNYLPALFFQILVIPVTMAHFHSVLFK